MKPRLGYLASIGVLGALILAAGSPASAQAPDSQELAKKLSNPIASLISVPVQGNLDFDVGPEHGEKLTFNVQPVLPIKLSDDWNMISRTILPIASQWDVVPGSGSQFGLGDVVQSLFFSPTKPTSGGIIWGIGPVLLVPTATDPFLGAEKWGGGPTLVALTQRGRWTVGILANHIWSFAGAADRRGISATFMQPFVSYTTAQAWTFSFNTESTYDWIADEWSVPFNLGIAKLVRIGKQPVSLSAGLRYYAASFTNGPDGFGIRFGVTLLFPK